MQTMQSRRGNDIQYYSSLGFSRNMQHAFSITTKKSDYTDVTECIVYVSGYDPLTITLLSFSFLIGWEFYGPSYLKC